MSAKVCPVCGLKLKCRIKIANGGRICVFCSRLSPNYAAETVETLASYYKEQCQRRGIFCRTRVIKNFSCETIVVDEKNKLFYIGKEKEAFPIIYRFDEVKGCEFIKTAPTQVVTKKKGGIGRAVAGGVLFGGVGAIVGASTAKSITTVEGGLSFLRAHLCTYAGTTNVDIYSPPVGAEQFFNICAQESVSPQSSGNEVEEILKYKELLDNGIITEEQFEVKKKELLNI